MNGQLHAPAVFPGEKAPGNHWVVGWVGPRAGLDDVEKRKFLTLRGLEIRSLGRPARSQSLYRLRYPDSFIMTPSERKYNKQTVDQPNQSKR
jgi:hypothetical protein